MRLRMFQKKKPGFTLLELLVVISIIGILTAIGAAAFSVAQKKSRDARQVGDIKSIQSALEQHYATNASSYHEDATDATASGTTVCPDSISIDGNPFTFPKNAKGAAYSCDIKPASYCVCADSEEDKGNSDGSCNMTNAGNGTHFCVKNLQ